MIGENRFKFGGLLVAGLVFSAFGQGPVDISGTVNDSKTGAPVAGAKVYLALNPTVTTTTGADGSFKLTGNAAVGVRAGVSAKSQMSFNGKRLDFTVASENTPVTAELFNFRGEKVRTLVDMSASRGSYSVNTQAAGLGGGVYFLRARVGKTSAAYRLSTVGEAGSSFLAPTATMGFAALTKSAAEPVDTLKCQKAGYRLLSKPLTKYSGIYPLNFLPGLPPGDLKIVSERGMPQVEWGEPGNVVVQVWDGGTQLNGGYKVGPFEGTQSWMITFKADQPHNAWGFVTQMGQPEDMSAWANGSMHLAVKGTATSVGVTMGSTNQSGGLSVKVDLAKYGYKPDNAWHECVVPLSDFTGTEFDKIEVYVGLVYPVETDTAPFDPDLFYQVDDIYWKLTK